VPAYHGQGGSCPRPLLGRSVAVAGLVAACRGH